MTRRTARITVAAIVALAATFPSSVWATSSGDPNNPFINEAYNQKYNTNVSCGACHNGATLAPEAGGLYFPYGLRLAQVITRSLNTNSAHIRSQMEAVEPEFAPFLNMVNGITINPSSGNVAGVTIPGNSTAVPLVFGPGLTRLGEAASLTQLSPSPAPGFSIPNSISTNLNVGITVSLLDRGNRRRANQPFRLQFSPVNSGFFKFTTASNLAFAAVDLTFANLAPIAVGDAFTTPGDQVLNGTVMTAGASGDRDPDSSSFTFELVTDVDVSKGTLTLNPNGDFTFTPAAPPPTMNDLATFEYRLRDGENALSNTVLVEITITPVVPANRPPEANDDSFSIDEDMVLTGANVLADNGNGADQDLDNDPLTVSQVDPPSFGTLMLNANGTFTYSPFQDATGDQNNKDTFTYALSDGIVADQATVEINFTPINDPPTATTIFAPTANEAQGVLNLDMVDMNFVNDPDGDALTVSGTTLTLVAPTLNNPTVNFTVSGTTLTFDTTQLEELDNDENAELTFDYSISDSIAPAIAGQLKVTILGLDNGVGRSAGQYANTIRDRYNLHFKSSNDAPASCHTCHNTGQTQADVDTLQDCTATIFTAYGLKLCLARLPGTPPLGDLIRRLQLVEPDFAPRLTSAPSIVIDDAQPAGTPIGQPLQATPGRNSLDEPSTIVGFGIIAGGRLGPTDASGQFRVDNNGQLSVVGPLTPGVYPLDVRPINDAGQRDNSGAPLPGIPGFFPVEISLLRITTVTVNAAAPISVNDSFNVQQATPSQINVLANDIGGVVTSVSVDTDVSNGTLVQGATGVFTYTPDPAFSGTDTFVYNSTGPGGTSDNATVEIKVVATGGAFAVDDVAQTFVNGPVTVDVLSNDLGDRPMTATITAIPAQGTASVNGSEITYTPPDGFTGTAVIRYRAENAIDFSEANLTVTVTSGDGAFLEGGTNDPTLKPVARALGNTCTQINEAGGPSGADQADLLDICGRLTGDIQNGVDVDAAFAAIRNEEMLAVNDIAMTTGRMASAAALTRLQSTRNGAGRGFNIGGVNIRFGNETVSADMFDEVVKYLAGASDEASAHSGAGSNPFGTFISGEINFTERDSTAAESGYDLTSFSVTGGLDYAVDENVIVGAALSVAHSETDFAADGGGLDANSYQLSLYGSVNDLLTPGLRLDGVVTGGVNQYSSDRAIRFGTGGAAVDRIARARFTGYHLNLVGRAEYDLAGVEGASLGEFFGGLTLTGFAELDYLYVWNEGYTERGAGGLSLAVQDSNYNSLLGEVGLRLAMPFETGIGPVTPFVTASASSELLQERPSLVSSFAAAGPAAPTFEIFGDTEDQFFGRIGAGATGKLMDADLRFEYGTVVGRDLFDEHSFVLSLGGPFLGAEWFGIDVGWNVDQGSSQTASNVRVDMKYELKF